MVGTLDVLNNDQISCFELRLFMVLIWQHQGTLAQVTRFGKAAVTPWLHPFLSHGSVFGFLPALKRFENLNYCCHLIHWPTAFAMVAKLFYAGDTIYLKELSIVSDEVRVVKVAFVKIDPIGFNRYGKIAISTGDHLQLAFTVHRKI